MGGCPHHLVHQAREAAGDHDTSAIVNALDAVAQPAADDPVLLEDTRQ